jgi:hypothetical protein
LGIFLAIGEAYSRPDDSQELTVNLFVRHNELKKFYGFTMTDTNEYYVYIYFDPRKQGEFIYQDLRFEYEPFYVGYGKNNRSFSHFKNVKNSRKICKGDNLHKINKIAKIIEQNLEPIIVQLYNNLSFEKANEIEIELIGKIGRNDLSHGPLTNLTDGGGGRLCFVITDEYRQKMSKAVTGENNGMFNKHHT